MCYLKTKIKNVVFLAGGNVPSISQKELAEISARKEKDEDGELKVKELADRANETIAGYRDRMKDLPPAFGASLHDSIVSYFLTSVSRYDKNKITGLNQNEFAEYRRDMLSKLRQIMDQHAPSKEQIAAREQAHRAAEQAAERAERAGDV